MILTEKCVSLDFSFMTILVMMMAPCIGQWTYTLGKIFRKGAESCSKRI